MYVCLESILQLPRHPTPCRAVPCRADPSIPPDSRGLAGVGAREGAKQANRTDVCLKWCPMEKKNHRGGGTGRGALRASKPVWSFLPPPPSFLALRNEWSIEVPEIDPHVECQSP
jgi:hypothetical protein